MLPDRLVVECMSSVFFFFFGLFVGKHPGELMEARKMGPGRPHAMLRHCNVFIEDGWHLADLKQLENFERPSLATIFHNNFNSKQFGYYIKQLNNFKIA